MLAISESEDEISLKNQTKRKVLTKKTKNSRQHKDKKRRRSEMENMIAESSSVTPPTKKQRQNGLTPSTSMIQSQFNKLEEQLKEIKDCTEKILQTEKNNGKTLMMIQSTMSMIMTSLTIMEQMLQRQAAGTINITCNSTDMNDKKNYSVHGASNYLFVLPFLIFVYYFGSLIYKPILFNFSKQKSLEDHVTTRKTIFFSNKTSKMIK
ncbi:hypothetical protein RFI_00044 [Reticulomyxa filosa]|uniref:Uncharacterized protein n=1 Tax=Reticulomyxa filosa TaxID=46433 RepID=X6PFM3_RETFI|nr:hypothetical protein RFI_00044 [Reticulomyxa filosa]|eukprot:ETO37021.1 hypothetical protein RFI_00044 [Reticulomyxa filosa]